MMNDQRHTNVPDANRNGSILMVTGHSTVLAFVIGQNKGNISLFLMRKYFTFIDREASAIRWKFIKFFAEHSIS